MKKNFFIVIISFLLIVNYNSFSQDNESFFRNLFEKEYVKINKINKIKIYSFQYKFGKPNEKNKIISYEYEYDKNANITTFIGYYQNSIDSVKKEFEEIIEYDKKDRPIINTNFFKSITKTIKYEYTDSLNLVKERYFNKNNTLQNTIIKQFDGNNNLMYTENKNKSGQFISRVYYKNDEYGNVIDEVRYGTEEQYYYSFNYDEKHRPVKKIRFSKRGDLLYKTTYSYAERFNKLTEEYAINAQGNLEYKKMFSFNKEANIISQMSFENSQGRVRKFIIHYNYNKNKLLDEVIIMDTKVNEPKKMYKIVYEFLED